MEENFKIKSTDKMAKLIGNSYSLLLVMDRFGIPLGFEEKSVREICEENEVDTNTFLAVANFVCEGFSRIDGKSACLSISSLVNYLRSSHRYFIDSLLPRIRTQLVEAIGDTKNRVASLIINLFDEYSEEIEKHMDFEDKTVFTYVDQLLDGSLKKGFTISTYSMHHDLISEKVAELKNVILRFCPKEVNHSQLVTVLYDIYACELGLEEHCKIEDYLFTPAILNLERRLLGDEE